MEDFAQQMVKALQGKLKTKADEEKVLEYYQNNLQVLHVTAISMESKSSMECILNCRLRQVTETIFHIEQSAVGHSKTMTVRLAPVHLAVLYGEAGCSKQALLRLSHRMKEDADFCKKVLLLRLETQQSDHEGMPDEACGLTTLHLAVKYNPAGLAMLLEVAVNHNLLTEVLATRDARGLTPLQFATFNQTPVCLQLMLNKGPRDL